MQTMAPNLAKPKRGKTTQIGRCYKDILEHCPNSIVKFGGTACKLGQILHFWTFLVVKSLRHKICDLKNELFVRMFWTQCDLKEGNFLRKIRPCSRGCKASFRYIRMKESYDPRLVKKRRMIRGWIKSVVWFGTRLGQSYDTEPIIKRCMIQNDNCAGEQNESLKCSDKSGFHWKVAKWS